MWVPGFDGAFDSGTTVLFPPEMPRATQFYIGEGRPCLKTSAGAIGETFVGLTNESYVSAISEA